MRINIVTSMSAEGYEKYGNRCIASIAEYWPANVRLMLWSENLVSGFYSLDADTGFINFLGEARKRNACFVNDYRKDAGKFAHKVFALTNPQNFEDCDWLIWLDADTETIAPVTEEFLKRILPDDADVVYLGRKDMAHSECGFMAFKMPNARAFLRLLRHMYTSGAIWPQQEWHDSWLFDRLRDDCEAEDDPKSLVFHNLSEGIPGMHVWDDCPIGEVMKHYKGPLRQKGIKPSGNEPKGYWSQKELKEAGVTESGRASVQIKTKNCVPDEEIQENVRYGWAHIAHWVRECKPHDELAVMCSGGPSLRDDLPKIRERYEAGHKVLCVKHSHDYLIENGIVPWGCFLLDPRSHVKEFIENPHPEVTYFVASMCHPSTIDRLNEHNAKVLGYNAHVGAGEDKCLPQGSILIGGGSTSAVRGISVLNALGFRRFHLFGYDSCYYDREPTAEKEKNGLPKWFEAEVGGRKFVTDAELLAQCQDFDKTMDAGKPLFTELEVYGRGMIPHIFALKRPILPELEEVIGCLSTPRAA